MTEPTAFIIHGRYLRPVEVLTEFLKQHGIEVHSVMQLANRRGGVVSIHEIVTEGISTCDVIIGLLNPDEAVSLYDSMGKSGNDSGWQPRPNVIFELGLAFGFDERKLILATLGEVRPFSDISGLLFLDLTKPNAKRELLEKIMHILQERSPFTKGDIGSVAGGFADAVVPRWAPYDELTELENSLQKRRVGTQRLALLEIVKRIVAANQSETWDHKGDFDTTGEKFMHLLSAQFPGRGTLVSDAFWYLLIYGFFEGTGIKKMFMGTWQNTSACYNIAGRGLALLEKIRLLPASAAVVPQKTARPASVRKRKKR